MTVIASSNNSNSNDNSNGSYNSSNFLYNFSPSLNIESINKKEN